MEVHAPNATMEETKALIRQPYGVVHCTLWDPVNNCDDTAMPGTSDKRQQRRLIGTLVASPFVSLDENGVEGCFFCFPDLSVRTPGSFSLRFRLVILDPTKMRAGVSCKTEATVKSDTFRVYSAKDFPGMRASTKLTKRLKHQGCLISVKKGGPKKEEDTTDSADDSSSNEDDMGTLLQISKRGKRNPTEPRFGVDSRSRNIGWKIKVNLIDF